MTIFTYTLITWLFFPVGYSTVLIFELHFLPFYGCCSLCLLWETASLLHVMR